MLGAGCSGASPGTADATASAAPSSSPSGAPAVTAGAEPLAGAEIAVGSKDYDEQLVLGQISTQALAAAGVTVVDHLNLGDTAAVRDALLSDQIDHYWEYTGIGWLVHLDNAEKLSDPQEQWRRVRDADRANGVAWTTPAPFNNTYGIAVTRRAAGRLGDPQTLSDFARLAEDSTGKATLCVDGEFASRADGLPGLAQTYGFELPDDNVTTLDPGVVYSAISTRDPCNFGEVFTTDGRIAALDLQVLDDDAGFFPIYNAAPVFSADTYQRHGRALDVLFAPIAAALTQKTMIALNKQVSADGELPEDVARSFLSDNDLLPE
ncbi:glycine betaine ABC transporter substrate-binding protein [soil metagenome]